MQHLYSDELECNCGVGMVKRMDNVVNFLIEKFNYDQ